MELVYLWITALCVTTTVSLDYTDLERLNVACSPRDTCKRPSSDFQETNCECDRTCLSYNDCCIDGPKATRRHRPRKLEGLTCAPFLPTQGVYSVSTCSPSWATSDDTRLKCETEDHLTDPLMSIPVMDTQKKVTYRNLHCAVCNSAIPDSLLFWSMTLTCASLSQMHKLYNNITQEFIRENVVRVGNSWGVYHWDQSTGGSSFFPCTIRFLLPQSVTKDVRYCRPHVVSTCALDWNRESGRKDCDSYMGVVYIKGQAYRNVHCALCNHVAVDDTKCLPAETDYFKEKWLSFIVLFDINREDTTNEDPNSICSSGQVYDTFAKKCRRLMCRVPGYVVKKGECVKN